MDHDYKLIIRGILKRVSVNEIIGKFGDNNIRLRVFKLIPILFLVSNRQRNNPIKKNSITKKLTEVLKLATRVPVLCFPHNWLCFKFQIDYPLDHKTYQDILNLQLSKGLSIHVSRDVARFGFPTTNLSNTLEYELQRKLDAFDLVFTQANVKVVEPRVKSLLSFFLKKFLPYSQESENLNTVLGNSYYKELLSNDTYSDFNGNNAYLGAKGEHANHEEILTINPNFIFRTLIDVDVLHGEVLFKDNSFYFNDISKIPGLNDHSNVWPSYLYQKEINTFLSVACRQFQDEVYQAIFIGGINNWMHFVMEDLPRLVEIDYLKLDQGIPIILKKSLSHQIIECIQKLTTRQLIFVNDFEVLRVKKLYYLELSYDVVNPKGKTKADYEAMFSKDTMKIFRSKMLVEGSVASKRLLIKREAGLFRPLVNHSKIERILVDKHSFTPIYLNTMKLSKIQSLFASAAIVVGEYGAGLANMVFMPKGSCVVELRGPLEKYHYEYESLGKVLELNYSVILGSNRKISKHGFLSGPYRIDPRILHGHIMNMQNLDVN